jgi:hypothetical protein
MGEWRKRVLAATATVRRPDSQKAAGTAVLIDRAADGNSGRLLTCRHVIATGSDPLPTKVMVGFPGLPPLPAIPLASPPAKSGVPVDGVLLQLRMDEPQPVPGLPEPVRLSGAVRQPAEVELLGYPAGDRTAEGRWRSFTVRGPTAGGLVQLGWTENAGSYPGDSGGPVVDAISGELVGLLREGSQSLVFDRYVPLKLLRRAGLPVPAPWLVRGQEAEDHFVRRARGQRAGSSGTDVFQGRTAALARIREWIASGDSPGAVLVVTGQPGAGKSAVIARAGLAAAHPAIPSGSGGSSGLLFHARAATADELRAALADLTGASDDSAATLLDGIDQAVEEHLSRSRADGAEPTLVVIVDALDEAASGPDRSAIAELLARLARRPWARVVVASRPLSPAGPYASDSLLREFGVEGPDADNLIDLDQPDYFAPADLERFAAVLLTQEGVRYPGPAGRAWEQYRRQPDLRDRLARVVASRANKNFLVVALAAVQLSERREPVDPAAPAFDVTRLPSTIKDALDRYLEGRGKDRYLIQGVLTALSYAEGTGLEDSAWQMFAAALGYSVTQAELDALRDSSAADYLLETTTAADGRVVRAAGAPDRDGGRRRPAGRAG